MDGWLGIDVGKTNLRVGVFSQAFQVLERHAIGVEDVSQALEWLAQRLGWLQTRFSVRGAGVSLFGPLEVDPEHEQYGAVVESSDPAWSGVNIPALVSRALGRSVSFDFDVNAGALGEAVLGAGRGLGRFVYLSVGTGVGAAVCHQGRTQAGLAPQFGHSFVPRQADDRHFAGTCRFHGECLQGLVSGRALAARWGVPAEHLAEDHAGWDLQARYLASACANLLYSFSPEQILLGSSVGVAPGLAERVNALLPGVLNGFLDPSLRRLFARQPAVARTALGADSSLTGAAEMARSGAVYGCIWQKIANVTVSFVLDNSTKVGVRWAALADPSYFSSGAVLLRIHYRLLLTLLAALLSTAGLLRAQTQPQPDPPIPGGDVRIHYHRPDGNYANWTLYAFEGTTEPNDYNDGPVGVTGYDSFGAYYDVGVVSGTTQVGIIIHNTQTGAKDPGINEYIDPATQGNEYWQLSAMDGLTTTPPNTSPMMNPNIPAGTARIHFFRPDNNYSGWTVYAFDDTTADTGNYNGGPIQGTGSDDYGEYYDVPLSTNAENLGFIVHNIQTGTKNTPDDLHLDVALYNEAWIISGDPTVYLTEPTAAQKLNANFLKLQAFWIDATTIAVQSQYAGNGLSGSLLSSSTASLALGTSSVTGATTTVPLTAGGALSAEQLARFPQLAGYATLRLPGSMKPKDYRTLLTGQLAVQLLNADGSLAYATGVQDAGVLDNLYAYTGKLGVVVRASSTLEEWTDFAGEDSGAVKIKVWAPTAQTMKLQLFKQATDTAPSRTVAMNLHDGVWVATLGDEWIGKYYLFDLNVYAPTTRGIVENVVSDPYSIDLALNGSKSRITDMGAAENQPAGWQNDRSPVLARVNDLSIYELHVRDFSVNDLTVPAAHRGFYAAFTDQRSDGMRHLKTLADSGLKAIHILPTFHFNSVNEDKSTWQTTPNLTPYAPDSTTQQADVAAVQANDAYNWGYDPDHYLAPEGSYAVDPYKRVKEYRSMVMGLHQAGLRVIQDVVFNHTSGYGEAPNSILDEVVPDYYNRLDADGVLETASCCADTATEHFMMGKLQQDAILWNARQYKIDGFRFDIMSFTFVSNLEKIKQALAKLTLEKDGIDGSKIYIYGEGFSFGETANNALGVNAQQSNLYGTGIGSFNDRIRDGVRGGGPFSDERVQGFGTGLYNAPSSFTASSTPPSSQLQTLLQASDWIRVGLTGNLRDFTFTSYTGATTTGAGVNYNGQPTGYTATPTEAVNYVSVHDNQDLFDTVQVKASEAETAQTRARRQVLSMSVVALGEGIPFFMAGDDLLRSKDMDQNSYDSGDWFNKIDWTGQGNNWGIGLPIASQNQSQWSFQQPLLANAALKPTPADIATTTTAFQEFLKIRGTSELFRMATEPQIQGSLTFLNTGPSQVPGLIVMRLKAPFTSTGEGYGQVVVVFNATSTEQSFASQALAGQKLVLHPIQQNSGDAVARTSSFKSKTGTLTVPALTTAVFVTP